MIIGLIGKIASGKSILTKIFAQFNFLIIEMDEISKKLDYRDSPQNLKIKKWFGTKYIKENGCLERKALRALVFENNRHLARLNKISHPLIKEKVMQIITGERRNGIENFVITGPILFQIKLDHICDLILEIRCREEILIKRIQERDNCSFSDAKNILDSQEQLFEQCNNKPWEIFINEFPTIAEYEREAYKTIKNIMAGFNA
ncbi:dephospho-CoA kinase [Candidatus Riflebacteria bacterium]